MTTNSFPSNPTAPLTYEAWDNGKAALTPETGVGKALKAMKAAWDKVDGNAFRKMAIAAGPDEVKEARKNMEKAKPALGLAIKTLQDLQKLAAEKAKSGGKTITFPAKSIKLLNTIAQAAKERVDVLETYVREAEEQAEKSLDGFELRIKQKIEMVEKVLTSIKEHEKAAIKIDKSLAETLKEAITLIKDDRNAAKEKVKLALAQVVALDNLSQQCEKASSGWRYDHTGLDAITAKIISDKSTDLMLGRKRVARYAKEAREKLQKVHMSVGKAN
jgi:hypothetical protein